jgi:hypothetical protein
MSDGGQNLTQPDKTRAGIRLKQLRAGTVVAFVSWSWERVSTLSRRAQS